MRIVFITEDYPDVRRNVFPFVKSLVEALAERGNECVVIAPYSISRNKRIYKQVCYEKTFGGATVMVVRPPYLSFSKVMIGKVRITDYFHAIAVSNGLKEIPIKPDVVYCHFWKMAFEAYPFCKKHATPLFVASGESVINELPGKTDIKQMNDYVSGVICVSSKNKDESIGIGLTTSEKCIVIPNATDISVFKLLKKEVCRKMLNIADASFVVAFVGWFNNRKGVLRVSEAIKKLQDDDIKSIFIGGGEMNPDCNGILFKGYVAHKEIPVYLNAADVFVLPTLQEGCCNAVVEALSCGLPVISSDRPFNWDILDESNSIMVDPEDVGQIANAIEMLKTDKNLLQRLADGALKKAKDLSISSRAEKIESYIKERCNV